MSLSRGMAEQVGVSLDQTQTTVLYRMPIEVGLGSAAQPEPDRIVRTW
jgi:hypothetical protein